MEQLLWQLISTQEGNKAAMNIRMWMLLTQKEIAQMLAITEPYLSQMFKQLYQEGVLRREGREMIIIDPQQLWREDDFEEF